MTLGFYLKQKRTQYCLIQTEAAQKIGVSRVRYSAMENDKVYSYNPSTLKRVAEFLGKSTDWVAKHLQKKK